eukprot:TRINITY_DN1082_c2_g1_i1.p1 TRINITY_DN1082_c2_g1~~TRINITY_DN1082_c2_g1_i1.p1  ORF type:complete len:418 (+),score=70.40 TRINITY_DN1082_c2_g1_i1:56-1309(+)
MKMTIKRIAISSIVVLLAILLQWEAVEGLSYHAVAFMEELLGVGIENEPLKKMGFKKEETAIVVLGYKLNSDGTPWPLLDQRIMKGGELMVTGMGDVVVFTGGAPRGSGSELTEAGSIRNRFSSCFPSIPHDKLLLEENSNCTWDNAVNTLESIKRKLPEIKSIIVVTNKFHQYRAVGMFRKVSQTFHNNHFSLIEAAVIAPSLYRSTSGGLVAPNMGVCPHGGFLQGEVGANLKTIPKSLKRSPVRAFDSASSTAWRGVDGDWLTLHAHDTFKNKEICGILITSEEHGFHEWDILANGEIVGSFSHVFPSPLSSSFKTLPSPILVAAELNLSLVVRGGMGLREFPVTDLKYLTSCDGPAMSRHPKTFDYRPSAPPPFRPWHYAHLVLPYATWSYELTKETSKEVVAVVLYTVLGKM